MDIPVPALFLGGAILALLAFQAWREWGPAWLRVDARLPGTARGALQVSVANRGWRMTRGLHVRVAWVGPDGHELVAFDDDLRPELDGRMEHLWTLQNPQRDLPRGDVEWRALVVDVTAANALRRRARLDMSAKSTTQRAECPERAAYGAPPCVDGTTAHRFEHRRAYEEGIALDWEVCGRCHFARPANRDPATEAAVEAARRARLQREEATMRRAPDVEREREERPPSRRHADADTMPIEVAYWTLGLPETASWEDVQTAHRKLARELHPDRAAPDARKVMEERMSDVNRARDRLRGALTPR